MFSQSAELSIRGLESSIRQGQTTLAIQQLQELFLGISRLGEPEEKANKVVQLYLLLASLQHGSVRTVDTEYLRQTVLEGQLMDAKLFLLQQVEQVIALNQSYISEHTEDTVHQIQLAVQENLADPKLNLKWIAQNRLCMSEDYLSKLFFRQTRQRFSAYLTDQRIQMVQILMRENPQIKLSQLCARIGLENSPTYLSTLFKKQVGITLTEYRKNLLK